MRPWKPASFAVLAAAMMGSSVRAGVIQSVTVDGPDAIFLAGRTDVVIPAANLPWGGPGTHLIRHGGATPEEALESLPPMISVAAGDVVRFLDPAVGGINFFNGFGPPFFGPDGNGSSGSNLTALDGISGYLGPQGPLAGVFLDNSIPNAGPAPATLNFTLGGLGTNFTTLSPALRQVFYIGNGVTSGGVFQTFVAPAGATRLFLAIPDGFGFGGAPGAYDDNDGSYQVRVGINQLPNVPAVQDALIMGDPGDLFGFDMTAVDGDTLEANLLWSLDSFNGGGLFAPTVDPATGLFSWDSAGAAPGSYQAMIRATDPQANFGVGVLTVIVNAPPSVPEPATLGLAFLGAAGLLLRRR